MSGINHYQRMSHKGRIHVMASSLPPRLWAQALTWGAEEDGRLKLVAARWTIAMVFALQACLVVTVPVNLFVHWLVKV